MSRWCVTFRGQSIESQSGSGYTAPAAAEITSVGLRANGRRPTVGSLHHLRPPAAPSKPASFTVVAHPGAVQVVIGIGDDAREVWLSPDEWRAVEWLDLADAAEAMQR